MRSLFVRGLALSLAVAGIAGCSKVSGPGSTQATSASGGSRHAYTVPHVLRFAAASDIQGLDGFIHISGYESYLSQLCGAFLIKTDAHGDATIPELITEIPSLKNGGIGADGKSITFHIRHNVKWSDGAPFDGDDVVFSTNQINNPANNIVSRDGWDQITKIEEPNKFTVIYRLKAPYSSFAETFFSTGSANPVVLPKHLLDGVRSVNDIPYNALPIGIGPFKFQEWKRGDSVVMVKNPLYFRGAPKLDRIVFKIIPDRNTVLAQLRTHEVDLWLPISPHYYPDATAIFGIKGYSVPGYYFDHLDFNLKRPVLQDLAVRQALRYGVDRDTMISKVQHGLYLRTESPVTPASSFYINFPHVPYDIAKGNALLDKAGWTRGADGIRTKNGLRLSMEFASSAGSPDADTEIEIIRSGWKQLGVDFTTKRFQASSLFAPAAEGGVLYAGKFDAVLFAWGSASNEDVSNLYACYRFPPDGQNILHWCDVKATAAMDRSKFSYDQSVRKAAIGEVQRAVYDQVPTVIIDARNELFAYSDDLKGWVPNPVAPFDSILTADI